MVMWHGRRASAVVCALVVVLGGCSSNQLATPLKCLDVRWESFVSVETSGSGWNISEFCLDDVCSSISQVVTDQPADYSYRLALWNADGASIQRDGIVHTKSYRVNGAGCEPVTANAVLAVGSSGVVTVRYLF